MRVPLPLFDGFGQPFEDLISRFATERKLMPEPEAIRSVRFLARSVVPHIQKLSQLFNRIVSDDIEGNPGNPRAQPKVQDQGAALDPYWKSGSNPENLRLAYFLYFMPANLFRVASVWAELSRLGYRWPEGRPMTGVEFGAGPAAGAAGIAAGEHFAPVGIPKDTGNWALIEQDKPMLELGTRWAETYFADKGFGAWGVRPFHRKLDLKEGFLPERAPRFNLWLMSFFLNELHEPAELVADRLLEAWDKHLADDGLIIFVEPALKLQSRRILDLRRVLLERAAATGRDWLKVLLPCLGHQACGALAAPDDWCHEEVSWWRPPYFKVLDGMAGLDRKTLPFSYLVLTKSRRPREEILTALNVGTPEERVRLVSPSHKEGKELEFFTCSQDGKRRSRFHPPHKDFDLDRGDILSGVESRGDPRSTRIEKFKKQD